MTGNDIRDQSPEAREFSRFLAVRMEERGLFGRDVAAHLGYDRPGIIAMIKLGETRMPLDKVGPLAEILEVDAVDLLVRVLACYSPQTADILRKRVGSADVAGSSPAD